MRGRWWVMVPGDVPDFSGHRWFTDALAKLQLELRRQAKGLKLVEMRSKERA